MFPCLCGSAIVFGQRSQGAYGDFDAIGASRPNETYSERQTLAFADRMLGNR